MRSFRPTEVSRAIELAQDVEAEVSLGQGRSVSQRGSFPPRFPTRGGIMANSPAGSSSATVSSSAASPIRSDTQGSRNMATAQRSSSSFGSTTTFPGREGAASRPRPAQRLPHAEFVKHLRNGTCFRCGLAYTSDHICPNASLRVTILGETEEIIVEAASTEAEELVEDLEDQLQCQTMELAHLVPSTITPPKTMRIWGEIAGVAVHVLIDCGASHNFVAPDLVSRMGLATHPTQRFGVHLGNGRCEKSQGCCKNLMLTMQGYTYVGDFFLFDLGGLDVVLGMTWLASLGDVRHNWKALTMTFHAQGSIIHLCGDSSLQMSGQPSKVFGKTSELEVAAMMLFYSEWLREQDGVSAGEEQRLDSVQVS